MSSKMYIGLHVKYPLFLLDFNGAQIFYTNFRKILKCKISWKSVQWKPSCSRRTDGRTDVMYLMVGFRSFAKAPKECAFLMKTSWWVLTCEIGAKAGFLYLCTAQVKIMWIYSFTAHITSSAWFSIKDKNVFCILF